MGCCFSKRKGKKVPFNYKPLNIKVHEDIELGIEKNEEPIDIKNIHYKYYVNKKCTKDLSQEELKRRYKTSKKENCFCENFKFVSIKSEPMRYVCMSCRDCGKCCSAFGS